MTLLKLEPTFEFQVFIVLVSVIAIIAVHTYLITNETWKAGFINIDTDRKK